MSVVFFFCERLAFATFGGDVGAKEKGFAGAGAPKAAVVPKTVVAPPNIGGGPPNGVAVAAPPNIGGVPKPPKGTGAPKPGGGGAPKASGAAAVAAAAAAAISVRSARRLLVRSVRTMLSTAGMLRRMCSSTERRNECRASRRSSAEPPSALSRAIKWRKSSTSAPGMALIGEPEVKSSSSPSSNTSALRLSDAVAHVKSNGCVTDERCCVPVRSPPPPPLLPSLAVSSAPLASAAELAAASLDGVLSAPTIAASSRRLLTIELAFPSTP